MLNDHEFLRDALIKSSFYFEKEVKRRASATADILEAKYAKREKKQVHLLTSARTMRAMCDSDSNSDYSDSDSDSSSEARYLDEISDDDDEDFC